MAHEIVPSHRPHDQLRTEAPKQRPQTDIYMSAFVSGESMVDMTFRNPILPKSADHFKVGIDELTVNLGNLSMLEFGEGDVLFRILRRGNDNFENHAFLTDFRMVDGPAGNAEQWRDAFEFKIDRAFLTMHEILDRCTEVATSVGTYIRENGLVQPGGGAGNNLWTIPWLSVAAGAAAAEHFRISITANGSLKFSGNRTFWANFAIDVPKIKYRQILFKDPDKRFVSLHPGTGNEVADPYVLQGDGSMTAAVLDPQFDPANYGDPLHTRSVEYIATGNLLNTLDRRVTLEVGCSLPIKNSPMVDHGQESPDFVLGRYMFHQPYEMKNWAGNISEPIPEITVPHLGTLTVQGPRDRVVFHHLQPQQKIQVLRLKLWARVRTYSEATGRWGMKTIVCPIENSDYWHIRLHFSEK